MLLRYTVILNYNTIDYVKLFLKKIEGRGPKARWLASSDSKKSTYLTIGDWVS